MNELLDDDLLTLLLEDVARDVQTRSGDRKSVV